MVRARRVMIAAVCLVALAGTSRAEELAELSTGAPTASGTPSAPEASAPPDPTFSSTGPPAARPVVEKAGSRRAFAARHGRSCKRLDEPPRSENETVSELEIVVADLRDFAECYRDKASRRQRFRDGAAATVALSVVALLVGDGKMADSSKAAWAAGAILPLLVTNLSGSSYELQLHQAVSMAMDRTAERYDELGYRWGKVEETGKGSLAAADCAKARAALIKVQGLATGSRRTVVEDAAQKTLERCRTALAAQTLIEDMAERAKDEEPRLADRARNDALDIAVRADNLNRAFRASPFQAFRTTAGAAPSIVGGLLSGAAWRPREDPRADREGYYRLVGRVTRELPSPPPSLPTDSLETALLFQTLDEIEDNGMATKDEADEAKATAQAAAVDIRAQLAETQAAIEVATPTLNRGLQRIRLLLAWEAGGEVDIDPRKIDAGADGLADQAADATASASASGATAPPASGAASASAPGT